MTWDEIDVAILAGKGGDVELEENEKVTKSKIKFIDWLTTQSFRGTLSDYLTEEREIEKQSKTDKTKLEKETIKYYKARGTTIKYYKIYFKKLVKK